MDISIAPGSTVFSPADKNDIPACILFDRVMCVLGRPELMTGALHDQDMSLGECADCTIEVPAWGISRTVQVPAGTDVTGAASEWSRPRIVVRVDATPDECFEFLAGVHDRSVKRGHALDAQHIAFSLERLFSVVHDRDAVAAYMESLGTAPGPEKTEDVVLAFSSGDVLACPLPPGMWRAMLGTRRPQVVSTGRPFDPVVIFDMYSQPHIVAPRFVLHDENGSPPRKRPCKC